MGWVNFILQRIPMLNIFSNKGDRATSIIKIFNSFSLLMYSLHLGACVISHLGHAMRMQANSNFPDHATSLKGFIFLWNQRFFSCAFKDGLMCCNYISNEGDLSFCIMTRFHFFLSKVKLLRSICCRSRQSLRYDFQEIFDIGNDLQELKIKKP